LYLNAQNNYRSMNDDMSYCKGHGCSAAKDCARYAPVMTYIDQVYFYPTPGSDETCRYFLEPQEGGKS